MGPLRRQPGFSLIEVLLAVATLAVGMLFIGGAFMLGIYTSSRATEQTIASVVAQEAVAKIRLYGFARGPDSTGYRLYGPRPAGVGPESVLCPSDRMRADEFLYPSDRDAGGSQRQYSWSAVCKKREGADLDSPMVQTTVFVCRAPGTEPRPIPTRLEIRSASGDRIQFMGEDSVRLLFGGSVLVDDGTGQVYRVLEIGGNGSDRVRVDRPWQGASAGAVWVVPRPSAAAAGRNPCIAVYQTELRMPDGPESTPNP